MSHQALKAPNTEFNSAQFFSLKSNSTFVVKILSPFPGYATMLKQMTCLIDANHKKTISDRLYSFLIHTNRKSLAFKRITRKESVFPPSSQN